MIGFLSALATGLATVNPVALWCTVVPLTFCAVADRRVRQPLAADQLLPRSSR